jgi:hypothetical protein
MSEQSSDKQWTREEDDNLWKGINIIDLRWSVITQTLPGRNKGECQWRSTGLFIKQNLHVPNIYAPGLDNWQSVSTAEMSAERFAQKEATAEAEIEGMVLERPTSMSDLSENPGESNDFD